MINKYLDIGTINAVKLLPIIKSYNGYVQLYTELDSHIEIGDTVIITYKGEIDPGNIILDNKLYDIYNKYHQGYDVIYIDKENNLIVLNLEFDEIYIEKNFSDYFISSINIENSNIYKADLIDSSVIKNSNININENENIINFKQAIVINGDINNTDINEKYDNKYLSLNCSYDKNLIKYVSINNNFYGYSYFYNLNNSIKECNINTGFFYNCNIFSLNNKNITNGFFDNSSIIKYNILGGYFNNTTLNSDCKWLYGIWNSTDDNIVFNLKNWKDGKFINGYFGDDSELTDWNDGDFIGGIWRGHNWFSGNFYNGTFEGYGYEDSSTSQQINSIWKDGTFFSGNMKNKYYNNIIFEKGNVIGGNLTNVSFNKTEFKGGKIYNSSINKSIIKNAYFNNSYISNSTINESTIENSFLVSNIINNGNIYNTSLFDNDINNAYFKNNNFTFVNNFKNGVYEKCIFDIDVNNYSKHGNIRKKTLLDTSNNIVNKVIIEFDDEHYFDTLSVNLKGFNSQELFNCDNVPIATDIYYELNSFNGSSYTQFNNNGDNYILLELPYNSWYFGDNGIVQANLINIPNVNIDINGGIYKTCEFYNIINIYNGTFNNCIMKNGINFYNGIFNNGYFYNDEGEPENKWYNGKFYNGQFGYLNNLTYSTITDNLETLVRTGETSDTITKSDYDFVIENIYPLHNSNIFIDTITNYDNSPWMNSGHTNVNASKIVVKVHTNNDYSKDKLKYILDENNFIDLNIVNKSINSDNYKYVYEPWKNLFKMEYILENYYQNGYDFYLILYFPEIADIYNKSDVNERDSFDDNYKNVWSIANSGYYVHPLPYMNSFNSNLIKNYYIYDNNPHYSKWIEGTILPPWWIKSTYIDWKGCSVPNCSEEDITISSNDINKIVLGSNTFYLKQNDVNTPNLSNISQIYSGYLTFFKIFFNNPVQPVNNNTCLTSDFIYPFEQTIKDLFEYHVKYNTTDINTILNYVIVTKSGDKCTLNDNNLDTYGVPPSSQNFKKKISYKCFGTTCEIIYSGYTTHDIKYSHNFYDGIIFEMYHKSKKNNTSLYDEFINSDSSYFKDLLNSYYNNQQFPNTIFDNDDIKYFKDVNKYLQTNIKHFEQKLVLQLEFKNPDLLYDCSWSGGTFYNGYFSSKWYGGNWINGIWEGRNYVNNDINDKPSNNNEQHIYYTENYNLLRKKKLYYDSPPWYETKNINKDIIKRKTNLK